MNEFDEDMVQSVKRFAADAQWSLAKHACLRIQDATLRTTALLHLAQARLESNELDEVMDILAESEMNARQIPVEHKRARVMIDIGRILDRAGAREQAIRIWLVARQDSLPGQNSRDSKIVNESTWNLGLVAEYLALAGQWELAN